jgi:hypothetical protein
MPALHVGMKTRFAVDFARVFGCFHIDLPSSQILKRLQASVRCVCGCTENRAASVLSPHSNKSAWLPLRASCSSFPSTL